MAANQVQQKRQAYKGYGVDYVKSKQGVERKYTNDERN